MCIFLCLPTRYPKSFIASYYHFLYAWLVFFFWETMLYILLIDSNLQWWWHSNSPWIQLRHFFLSFSGFESIIGKTKLYFDKTYIIFKVQHIKWPCSGNPKRFEQYGSNFTFYDYNQPGELLPEFRYAYQDVVVNPPYLVRHYYYYDYIDIHCVTYLSVSCGHLCFINMMYIFFMVFF